jgi:hypothetical protein
MSVETGFADYGGVQAQWQELLAGSVRAYNRDAPDYLAERIATLTVQAPSVARIDQFDGNFQHFLGPDTVFHPTIDGAGFRMDDPAAYGKAVEVLPRYRKLADYTALTGYRATVLGATQRGLEHYLGSNPGPTAKRRHTALLKTRATASSSTSGDHSIADFKRAALCAQRVAVASNIHHVFGCAPVCEIGLLQVDTQPQVLHAFMVIRGNGEDLLYDPTNPALIVSTDARRITTLPAIFPVGQLITTERFVAVGAELNSVITRDPVNATEVARHHTQLSFTTVALGKALRPV